MMDANEVKNLKQYAQTVLENKGKQQGIKSLNNEISEKIYIAAMDGVVTVKTNRYEFETKAECNGFKKYVVKELRARGYRVSYNEASAINGAFGIEFKITWV